MSQSPLSLETQPLDSVEAAPVANVDPVRIGLFIEKRDKSAWCAVFGDQVLEGAGAPTGLPSGWCWATNLPYDVIKHRDLAGGFRDDRFFRILTKEIFDEWSVACRPDGSVQKQLAVVMSRVCRNALATAHRWRKARQLRPLNIQLHRTNKTLSGVLNDMLDGVEDPGVGKASVLTKITANAALPGVTLNSGPDRAWRFTVPRFSYHAWLASHRVPAASGRWERVGQRPLEDPNALTRLRQINRPAMLRVAFSPRKADPAAAARPWTRRANGDPREWVTLEEAIILDSLGDLRLLDAVIGDGWDAAGPLGQLFDAWVGPTAEQSPLSFSWSAGLAAENLAAACLRKHRKFETGIPLSAVWLMARDRMTLAPMIEAISAAGGDVVSAYLGSVVVRVPDDPEVAEAVLGAALERGLLPPLALVGELQTKRVDTASLADRWQGSSHTGLLAEALCGHHRNVLWSLDRVIDMPPEQATAFVAQLSGDTGS